MKLYHGSTHIVRNPLVSYGRANLDFGKGFYTTSLQTQAENWVQRFILLGKKAFVNIYEFDNQSIETKYKYKRFSAYDEEWLDFILTCRSGNTDYVKYDIVEGGVANDRVFNTVELFFSNLIDKKTALSRLRYKKPNNQICFISQSVLETVLHFSDAYEIGIQDYDSR